MNVTQMWKNVEKAKEALERINISQNKDDIIGVDAINQSIEKYVHKLTNGIDDKSLLIGVTFIYYHDDLVNLQRIYKFESLWDNKEYGIAITLTREMINKERENNMAATMKPASYPPVMTYAKIRPIPPPLRLSSPVVIKEEFSLGLFAKCELCGCKHFTLIFKFNYNSEYVCKKCCSDYDIDSIERYKVVKQIREDVKNNLKGGM